MKTIFEYIKQYPEAFMDSALRRSHTSPSNINVSNHKRFIQCIEQEQWVSLEVLINSPEYRSPLDGVVVCLNKFSDIPSEVCVAIYDSWLEGEI